jgi:hypothetical protein
MTDNKLHWHWTCNNKIFFNKFNAITENLKTNLPIHFVPQQDILTKNFATQSNLSWDQVLAQRVRNLREQHKYIKVWFSGGIDSKKMLTAFLDNNIFIDEIVCVKSGIHSADYEINDIALPYLKEHQHRFKKTKIKIITPTINDYRKIFSNPNWMEDFVNLDAWHFRLNSYFENLEYKTYDCANIMGKEKPLLIFKDNEWWITWLDLRINPAQISKDIKINFYDDDTDIIKHQSHSLKNYIVNNFNKEDYNSICFYQSSNQKHLNVGCGRLNKVEEDFILKSFSKDEKFMDYKNKRIYFTNTKDKIAIKEMLKIDDQLVLNWKNSIDDYANQKGIASWFNNNAPELGTRGIFSDFYSLQRNICLTIDELFPDGFTLS